jgi:hypothetical protein
MLMPASSSALTFARNRAAVTTGRSIAMRTGVALIFVSDNLNRVYRNTMVAVDGRPNGGSERMQPSPSFMQLAISALTGGAVRAGTRPSKLFVVPIN